MEKISREVAQAEVEKWLDYKRVNSKKRETYEDNIETLVESITNGFLTLGEDHVFQHSLKFPITNSDGETTVSTLEYKPRIKVSEIQKYMQGIKPTDGDGRVAGLIAALTGKTKAIVKDMDTEDYTISQAIAIFFL